MESVKAQLEDNPENAGPLARFRYRAARGLLLRDENQETVDLQYKPDDQDSGAINPKDVMHSELEFEIPDTTTTAQQLVGRCVSGSCSPQI